MPFEITNFKGNGYAISSAKEGEELRVAVQEFVSSEDGDLLISRLEGFPSILLKMIDSEIPPSQVDHMLALINKDGTGTVYLNELSMVQTIRSKVDLQQGDLVYDDDIADIKDLKFPNVTIKPDQAVIFLFSYRWRKGFFYDFAPLNKGDRQYDISVILGYYFKYLMFQDVFKMQEHDWDMMFHQNWFPFVTLRKSTVKKMLRFLRNNWTIDDMLNEIISEVTSILPERLKSWQKNTYISPHFEVIERAAERFIDGDYISANHILYPRIEGVIRSYFNVEGVKEKAKQGKILEVIEAAQSPQSLLLPKHFRIFLKTVYFAGFDKNYSDKVSRHSVAHGVADKEAFNEKSATLGFLILDQIFYILHK